jgi:hypothetical protein
MILKAQNEGGGGAYPMRQANENPADFMTLLGRVLPLQVTRANCGPVLLEQMASIPLVALEQRREGESGLNDVKRGQVIEGNGHGSACGGTA